MQAVQARQHIGEAGEHLTGDSRMNFAQAVHGIYEEMDDALQYYDSRWKFFTRIPEHSLSEH